MRSRSLLRETIVKALYQIFIYESKSISYDIDEIIKELTNNEDYYIHTSIVNILEKKTEYTKLINKYLKDWTLDRLSKVDQAILLLSVYELLDTDTPDIVCINEAVELAKQYSDDAVVKMINACLDKIYKNKIDE